MGQGQQARRTDICPVCKSKNIVIDEKENYDRFDHKDGDFCKYYIQWDCKDCGAKGSHVYSMKISEVTVEK